MNPQTVVDQRPLLNGLGSYLENFEIQPWRSEHFEVFRTGEEGKNFRQWTGDLLRKSQGVGFIRHQPPFFHWNTSDASAPDGI